jgi:polyhydroxybutyrate depolymerase
MKDCARLRRLVVACLVAPAGLVGCGSHGGDAGGGDSGQSALGQNCATRTGMRGKTVRTVTAGGLQRTYVAYLPQSLEAGKAAPLVFVFHGAAMTGENMYDVTGYSALADSEGFAVVFPDGQGSSSATSTPGVDPWNVSDKGAAVCGAGNFVNNSKTGVDFEFLDAIKADIETDQCVDAAHVFATGFSMGGYFTHHIGCDRTDIKAVAPGSGGTIATLSGCATGHTPVIIFHGTADPLIAPGCDDPNSAAQGGFPPSATLWAQKNGCQTTYATTPEDRPDGGDGQCYLYDGCPADGQVELCTFTGMSHCWAGGVSTGSGSNYACPTYASATQLTWDFWKKYAW